MGFLRFLLAIDILISHFPPTSIGHVVFIDDAVAVKTFFILSGFFISFILTEKYNIPCGYRLYLTNRILRLVPAYWVVLVLSVVGSWVSGAFFDNWGRLLPYMEYWDVMAWPSICYLVIANIFMIGQDAVRFMFLDLNSGMLELTTDYMGHTPIVAIFMFVPQAWALGIELVFYIVAPLLSMRDKRVLVALLVAILAGRYFITSLWQLPEEPWVYGFFPFELPMFILGILAYRVYRMMNHSKIPGMLYWMVYLLVILFTVCWFYLPGTTVKAICYYGVIFLSLPVLFAGRKDGRLQKFFGDLSYPIYISHILVRDVLLVLCQAPSLVPYIGIFSIIGTIGFSIALHCLVVSPIETYRQNRVLSAQDNIRCAGSLGQ